MSMCATVHMKATWLSTALWFMPLITTTQRCFQQQQSSAEGWQQWDTCQSVDEKMFHEVAVFFFYNFDFFFLFFFFPLFCLFVSVCFAISYQRLLMNQNVESVSHLWQIASLPLWEGGSVLHCLCCDLSTDLFPPACPSYCHTVTGKNMLCLYDLYFWHFLHSVCSAGFSVFVNIVWMTS